jgi:two-component system response regulator RegA
MGEADALALFEIQRTVLIVDDDVLLRNALARALRGRGYEVHTAANHDQAVASVRRYRPHFAILDLRIGDHSGVEVLRTIKQLTPRVKAVIMSGYASIASAVASVRAGAVNFLPKPVQVDELLAALNEELTEDAVSLDEDWRAPSGARAEWEHINRVLAECGGNISEAARRMGMHRRSLQRKLSKQPPPR